MVIWCFGFLRTPLAVAALWTSLGLLAYTFVGFRLLVVALSRRPHQRRPKPRDTPCSVAVVVVAHNEAARIRKRYDNLLRQDILGPSPTVVIVCDGCTDETVEILNRAGAPNLKVIDRPFRSGKAACINAALSHDETQKADIVVFADARQRFAANTVSRLVEALADPEVGAVSGALELETAESSVGQAVDTYWRQEKRLREAEARYDSCIGCTGAVYAIRRDLFQPIPEDTLLDDVVIPMQIALRGYRVLFEPSAVAFDPQPLEPASEAIRKRRTLAGNFQMLFRYPEWLLPWRNRLWWQLLSHKYLRLAAPGFLILVFVSSGCLFGSPFYRVVFLVQCLLYLLGIIGRLRPSWRHPIVAIPAGFLFLNTMTVCAFWHYLTSPDLHRWQKTS